MILQKINLEKFIIKLLKNFNIIKKLFKNTFIYNLY